MAAPAAPHGPSLRRQLLVPLGWIWLVGTLVAVGGALLLARASANAAFDRGLQDEASALAAKIVWTDRGPLLDLSRQTMELLTWDVSDRNSFVMVDSEDNPLAGDATVPLPPRDRRAASFGQPMLFDAAYQSEPVRGALFSVQSPMLDRTVAVAVIETKRRRTALTRQIQLGIVVPALALGLLTFVLLSISIRRGLQPLREVAHAVAAREPHDWRPLPLVRVPAEAVPLIERINLLLDDMQQAITLQRRFVADAAHQLRTPLAGLRVLVQELAQELAARHDGAPAAARWQPLLEQLLGSTDRMTRLVTQLLNLARSETALAVEVQQASMDVVPIVREAAEPLALQAMREGHAVVLEAPEQPVVARAHPLWLGEVLVNLLDNARRYGGPAVRVRVRGSPAGGATIEVEDDGEGVDAAQLPRLFDPFWRGERADLRNDGGTGLGLAIAREIVERLGGTMTAATRPQVPGMRFTIELPA